jgi:hypothetical protein
LSNRVDLFGQWKRNATLIYNNIARFTFSNK